MNRITSFLALSAIVIAGAFAGTAAQASANVIVDFRVQNGDGSATMVRSGSLPPSFSGFTVPAPSVAPGGYDPATGFGRFTASTPAIYHFVQGSIAYADANNASSACTFSITVTRTGLNAYQLHFADSNSGTHCSVPADASNSDGQFTGGYTLLWSL